jgi:hypothetical protein
MLLIFLTVMMLVTDAKATCLSKRKVQENNNIQERGGEGICLQKLS